MVWIEGGRFTMGDDEERPEERAAHEVTVKGFWIDRHEVTNAEFARFVEATGYVTVAERGLDPKDHPGMPPELLAPGAVVFTPPDGVLDLVDVNQWWRYVAGADWRHPSGPGSSIEGRDNHPVVNVAYEDALAYAEWLGRALPTEAQWEFAARGGLDGATYSWGDEYYDPVAGWRANSWQGLFPLKDDADDGYPGTAPVGCFAPNGYGLFDMAGNVWEYARDWYVPEHPTLAGDRSAGTGHGAGRAIRRADGPVGRDQGRLVPVRAQLLRPLPAGRAPASGARPRRQPPRFPHGPERPGRKGRSTRRSELRAFEDMSDATSGRMRRAR